MGKAKISYLGCVIARVRCSRRSRVGRIRKGSGAPVLWGLRSGASRVLPLALGVHICTYTMPHSNKVDYTRITFQQTIGVLGSSFLPTTARFRLHPALHLELANTSHYAANCLRQLDRLFSPAGYVVSHTVCYANPFGGITHLHQQAAMAGIVHIVWTPGMHGGNSNVGTSLLRVEQPFLPPLQFSQAVGQYPPQKDGAFEW